MFGSLLAGAGAILGQLLDEIMPILVYCLNAEELELRLQYVVDYTTSLCLGLISYQNEGFMYVAVKVQSTAVKLQECLFIVLLSMDCMNLISSSCSKQSL